eukprot:587103-Alexandrium_andersonii.AAC.1
MDVVSLELPWLQEARPQQVPPEPVCLPMDVASSPSPEFPDADEVASLPSTVEEDVGEAC